MAETLQIETLIHNLPQLREAIRKMGPDAKLISQRDTSDSKIVIVTVECTSVLDCFTFGFIYANERRTR